MTIVKRILVRRIAQGALIAAIAGTLGWLICYFEYVDRNMWLPIGALFLASGAMTVLIISISTLNDEIREGSK